MCFPSKRQKDNFTDDSKSNPNPAKNAIPTKADPSSPPKPVDSAPPQAPPTLPQVTTTEVSTAMPTKVGIIIYSMYGHVAKSSFIALLDPVLL